MPLNIENQTEFEKLAELCEQHAYSVRQLIAQRSRLFEVMRLAGEFVSLDSRRQPSGLLAGLRSFTKTAGQPRLKKILDCVETTPSQFLADIFCLLLNGGKESGFFVEFGACEGLTISNTSTLECEFGWRGILSEPSKRWQSALHQNRKCSIETRCVWSESGKKIEFAEIAGDVSGTLSGIVETALSSSKEAISDAYLVETITLADLLREHHAPKKIDFISIDTEGSEYEILKNFPFHEYTFGFMCVEHHSGKKDGIKSLLERAGYRHILQNVSGYDGFYVPRPA